MKKKLGVLALILLLALSLAGCGKAEETTEYNQEQMNAVADAVIQIFGQMEEENFQAFYELSDARLTAALLSSTLPVEGKDFISMMEAWQAGIDECGAFKAVKGREFSATAKGAQITLDADFEDRPAQMVITFDKKMNMKTLDVNAEYSLSEILKKAALNTVLGMGAVFVVLIFISYIISLFKYIPRIQNKFAGKAKGAGKGGEAPKEGAPDEGVCERETAGADEGELIAVIAAAAAAAAGSGSNGFVVRSVRRRSTNKWR